MKVGFFTDTYFPQVNGVTYTIAPWKRELEKKGNKVSVYFPLDKKYSKQKNEFGFHSINFPMYKDYRLALPFGVSKFSRNLDLVHIHTQFLMAAAGWHVSKKYKLPRVFTYHTPIEMYNFYFSKNKFLAEKLTNLYLYWEKRLLNSCNAITVGSNYMKNYLRKKGIRSRIEVVPNGINLNLFKPVNKKVARKKYGVKSEKVIGYCGRIGYEKHLEDLIGIAPSFDGEILIAGDGPAAENYKKSAEKYRNVRFLNFLEQKELPSFYSALDLFVIPSTVETLSLVTLEAMACGTPVIGADALALKETIEKGKTGFLYKPGNRNDLMRKITKLYASKNRLKKNCIKYAKKFSFHSAAERLLSLYENL